MFRRTSQKSVLRERSNSQIFPYIIHSLQPKRGIAPLHEVGEEILRTDEREGRTWMQWRAPPYFQLDPRTVTRCPCHRHSVFLLKESRCSERHEKQPTVTWEPSIYYPCRASEDCCWLTLQGCLLQKVQVPEDQLYRQRIDVAQVGAS